jgi:hypothetical protein
VPSIATIIDETINSFFISPIIKAGFPKLKLQVLTQDGAASFISNPARHGFAFAVAVHSEFAIRHSTLQSLNAEC